MPPFITTSHNPAPPPPASLAMDDSGVLWLDFDGVVERVGHVEGADVPRALWAEHSRLLDDYRDSLGGGHRDEAFNAYERAKR